MTLPTTKDGGRVEAEAKMVQGNIISLVDSCLEEGQYEAGLDVLRKAQAPSLLVAPYHLRLLIYIALYSRAPDAFEEPSYLMSPRKGGLKKLAQPTRGASEKALSFLQGLVITIDPVILMRALPGYGKTYDDGEGWRYRSGTEFLNGGSTYVSDPGPQNEDNLIATKAADIAYAKHIWEILLDGFIKDDVNASSSRLIVTRRSATEAPATPKRRMAPRKAKENPGAPADGSSDQERAGVADNAWPVLNLFLSVFEKDEKTSALVKHVPCSPLLSMQIPISTPREDIETPLYVAFCAFQSPTDKQRRFSMGMRLINLLVHLAYAPASLCLSPAACVRQIVRAVTNHTSKSGTTSRDFIRMFLMELAPSTPSFKLAFCCLYLAEQSEDGDPSKFVGGKDEEAFQETRASPSKPKPLRRGGPGSVSSLASSDRASSSASSSARDPFPPPSLNDLLELFAAVPPERDACDEDNHQGSDYAYVKLGLIEALYQLDITNPTPISQSWATALTTSAREDVISGIGVTRGRDAMDGVEAAVSGATTLLDAWST